MIWFVLVIAVLALVFSIVGLDKGACEGRYARFRKELLDLDSKLLDQRHKIEYHIEPDVKHLRRWEDAIQRRMDLIEKYFQLEYIPESATPARYEPKAESFGSTRRVRPDDYISYGRDPF